MSDRVKYILPAALLTACLIPQVWIVSGGSWTNWPVRSHCYSRLAEAFLHGKTDLGAQPAADDPHPRNAYVSDPDWAFESLDISIFNGRVYYYWGPAPAALAAAVCLLLGIAHPSFGDEYLCFLFAVGTIACAGHLIFQIRRRLFSSQPVSTADAAVVSLALGAPVLFNLEYARIYETAIFAGQFFLLAGLCAAWHAMTSARFRVLLLAAAGTCWALAAGSRISLPPAVAALAAITLWKIPAKSARGALALLLPLAAGAVILAWYNHARFGSILESGESYQVNHLNDRGLLASGFISPRNLPPNLTLYLLMPPLTLHGFPYLLAATRQPWLGGYFAVKWRTVSEPVIGLLWTQPLLALAALAPWLRRRDNPAAAWLIGALAASGFLAALSPLTVDFTTMRYLLDAVPIMTILAATGYWVLLERLAHRPRGQRELRAAVWVVVALQCAAGILLAAGQNKPLAHRIAQHLPIL